MFNDENIVCSAFGNVSRIVQHKAFIRSRQICLDPRHHVV